MEVHSTSVDDIEKHKKVDSVGTRNQPKYFEKSMGWRNVAYRFYNDSKRWSYTTELDL